MTYKSFEAMKIENWKLKQLINDIKIVDEDSIIFLRNKLQELGIPRPQYQDFARSDTNIDWSLVTPHFSFFFDETGNEEVITNRLLNSDLKKVKEIIINYGFDEPTVAIDKFIFINDWEEIFASTVWQTVIFSDDCTLIMEVSRDYILHSNFLI